MSTDPTAAYLDAKKRLDAVAKEVKAIVGFIEDAAAKLSGDGWKSVFIDHAGMSGPSGAVLSRKTQSIEGREWPSVKQMADALMDWHKAKEEAVTAWARLSPELQQNLRGPA